MDRYHVVWGQEVLDELAALWMSTANRSLVTAAADAIDEELRTSPRSKGTDLGGGIFSLSVTPLYVIFDVVDDDRFVRILAVTGTHPESQ